MPRILIVDDDEDFNTLLKDIFEQSNYDVETVLNPVDGFDAYCQRDFDLVVTDQKMPGLTGDQLIRKMHEVKSNVPIIMVSGYLDNETIRSLIREGVDGVFLKPLNVFSLLKRAASLIESNAQNRAREEHSIENPGEALAFDHGLPFPFRSYPGKDKRSIEFARKLHYHRDFKTNLIIIGHKGTDFDAIVTDLMAFETGVTEYFERIGVGELSAESMIDSLAQAQHAKAARITFVIDHPETLESTQCGILYSMAKAEEPFQRNGDFAARFVFLLSEDLDTIYDRGDIDDDLYMFMGTTEVRVPAIREVRDDLPLLSNSYLKRLADETDSSIPTIDSRARMYLREREWRGNQLELRTFCREMFALAKATITREDVEAIEQKFAGSNSLFGEFNLRDQLRAIRDDYCLAAMQLFEGDTSKAASFLGTTPSLMETIASAYTDQAEPTGD